ncbi:MAG: AraC family transcriptional regulator [Lachnospiraceae bacterium]|jgi:AraC family transcriptional activator of mtrCDE|nr:AraC family transcriptional regulator [Lachnospiraceae bacterium]
MKKLHSLISEQKEDAKHGASFFPIQKYITSFSPEYPVLTTHWHEEAEFTLILSGTGTYHIELTEYGIGPEDLIFIPPLALHSASAPEGLSLLSETYVFHMNYLGGNSTDICSTKYLQPLAHHEMVLPSVIKPGHPSYLSLRKIFGQISNLYQGENPGYELALKALLLQMIFLLLQFKETAPAFDGANAAHSEKLKTVLDYLELHYMDAITVSGLAGLCYFSEYHFMRFFKKHMNMTCMEYLINLRLEKAVELLEDENASILEVSLSVGFHNLSYFHRAFKKKYHMTPGEFLQMKKSNATVP